MRVSEIEFQRLVNREKTKRKSDKPKATYKPGVMNSTEIRYANLLDLRAKAGEIDGYRFESIKLRLADRTWYTPDFVVMRGDLTAIEFHEVKGFWRDDAKVKIKVAAEMYPEFAFIVAQYIKGNWEIRSI
jgi:hypothetical protein